mgnify:CR=1 FL=1|tara:strand:- start:7782 stop:8600 length:819 start_codon:yes stop_codon:yes gene_type:complete
MYLKNLLLSILFTFFAASLNYANTLNIITDSDTAVIKLNKEIIGTAIVSNYDVKTGTFLVTIEENGIQIYSEIIEIKPEKEVTTISINVENKLAKEVIDSKKQKELASYALDKKGKLGLGFYLDPSTLGGLKFSYDFSPITIQSVFWMSQTNSSDLFVGGIRFVNYFNNQFTKHTLFRLYSGFSYIYGKFDTESLHSYEIPLGAEFKLRQQLSKAPIWSYLIFSYMALGYNIFASIDGLFYFVETGLKITDHTDNSKDYKGLKFALGLKYYF